MFTENDKRIPISVKTSFRKCSGRRKADEFEVGAEIDLKSCWHFSAETRFDILDLF